jgi:hypothetical protein
VGRIESAPAQRPIDSFESAFNTIITTTDRVPNGDVESALASALKIELPEAGALIACGKPLPVARSHTRQEAELISALVRTCGLGSRVVPDEDLMLGRELVRARRLTVADGDFDVTHSGGVVSVPVGDVRLLVVGVLRNVRIDYTEGISSRNQAGAPLDSSEFRVDEMLLDVYAARLDQSFRIRAEAFDYSGIVQPLSFRAEANFQAVVTAICDAAPTALVDDDFPRVRGLLGRAWPERSRTEARGIRRSGLSYRPVAQSSVINDNRDQFDRYSRLMFRTRIGETN